MLFMGILVKRLKVIYTKVYKMYQSGGVFNFV